MIDFFMALKTDVSIAIEINRDDDDDDEDREPEVEIRYYEDFCETFALPAYEIDLLSIVDKTSRVGQTSTRVSVIFFTEIYEALKQPN